MEESSLGKHEYRGKGRRVKYWALLSDWISPRYGLFLLGSRFETYEPFISLVLPFFFWGGGFSKLQVTETVDTGSADIGAHLYLQYKFFPEVKSR
jgi:hypothetical protein